MCRMIDKPYQSPNPSTVAPIRTKPRSVLTYLTSSAVLGTLAGTAAMSAYSFFIVAPIWGPRMYKSDDRWETIFFIAGTLLPVSAIVGIALALALLRFTSFRLNYCGVIISCLAIMFFVCANKPMISRIRGKDYPPPRFEWMPDLMCAITAGMLAVTLLSMLVNLFFNRGTQSTSSMDGTTRR